MWGKVTLVGDRCSPIFHVVRYTDSRRSCPVILIEWIIRRLLDCTIYVWPWCLMGGLMNSCYPTRSLCWIICFNKYTAVDHLWSSHEWITKVASQICDVWCKCTPIDGVSRLFWLIALTALNPRIALYCFSFVWKKIWTDNKSTWFSWRKTFKKPKQA